MMGLLVNLMQIAVVFFAGTVAFLINDQTFSMRISRPACLSHYDDLIEDSHLNSRIDLSIKKRIKAEPIKVELDEKDISEKFVKGGGKGGQKINKTMNRVVLVHEPTGIRVSCQEARDLDTNRKLARKLLVEKLDVFYNQEASKLRQQHQKIRKRKQNAKRY